MNKFGTQLVALCVLLGLALTACGTAPSPTPSPTRAQLLQSPSVSSASPVVPTALETAASTAQPSPVIDQPQTTTPAPTAPPLPSPTSFPQPRLRHLTSGRCCTNPFWSDDSRYVQFIDRPASRPLGIYGVEMEHLGPPTLLSKWIVNTSGGGEFYVYPDGNTTIVQRAASGEQYVIANGGRPVSVSPDGQRLLWQVMEQRGDFDRRRSQTWVAGVDGSDARMVAETMGFSWSEWIDGRRILLVGLPLTDLPLVAIAALTLGAGAGDDQLVELAQVARPHETLISPQGNWLVYLLSFQASPNDDGLWLVPTAGGQPPRKLDFFGSYHWRDDTHLLYVPLEPGVESHTLWEYDVVNDEARRLTDPTQRFKIANNDWAVSPNGRYVVFVNAADHNLWLVDLEP